MRETLAMLVELQSLEDALRDLRINKQRLATLQTENAETKEVFLQMLAQQRLQIEETQAFCTEKETDIKGAEENARRARTRMSGVTSQRELTALNKELEIARRTNQQRTEEVVKLLDDIIAKQVDISFFKNQVEQHQGEGERLYTWIEYKDFIKEIVKGLEAKSLTPDNLFKLADK